MHNILSNFYQGGGNKAECMCEKRKSKRQGKMRQGFTRQHA